MITVDKNQWRDKIIYCNCTAGSRQQKIVLILSFGQKLILAAARKYTLVPSCRPLAPCISSAGMLLSMNHSTQQGQASPQRPSNTWKMLRHPKLSGVYLPNEFASSTNTMHHQFVTPNSSENSAYNMIGTAVDDAGRGASMPAVFVSEQVDKRKRDEGCNTTHYILAAQQLAPKKLRNNTYMAPRCLPPTFTSQTGSLVVANNGNDPRQVGFRRQLSTSKIEVFLGDHDAMDVDTETTRPRSMSF